MSSNISAVVRTWNSATTLAKTLSSVRMQQERPGEIIVVDSGSTDGTQAIADRYGCRWLDYPEDREFNYSESLNLGIAAAHGSEILIISSHTVLIYRDILAAMSLHLRQQAAAGVYCSYTRARESLPRRNDEGRGNLVEITRAATFHGHNGLSNACSLIDRQCWEQHPFDPSMPGSEDQEWAHWFFQHTNKPTVRIKNPGVLYLNPRYSIQKRARAHITIATRLLPAMRSWPAIARMFCGSARSACHGERQRAAEDFFIAKELLKSRFHAPHYSSRPYEPTDETVALRPHPHL